jgi:hypothetical protein
MAPAFTRTTLRSPTNRNNLALPSATFTSLAGPELAAGDFPAGFPRRSFSRGETDMAITITVTFSELTGVVANNATVPPGSNSIIWEANSGVVSITSISGLPNPPFLVSLSSGGWTATDDNSGTSTMNFPYNLHIWDGTSVHIHDPQITNEPQ